MNRTVLGWGALALLGFFEVESGFAVLRESVLVRHLGESATQITGYLQAELLLAFCAWVLFRHLRPALTRVAVMAVALEWLLLGMLMEGLIARAYRGLSWPEIAARFNPVSGRSDSFIVATSLLLVPLLVGLSLTPLSGSCKLKGDIQGGQDSAIARS